jgi:RNA polymerase sigma-54 factor
MHLQIKHINKLNYKLKLTPHIKLTFKLLQLPLLKLKEFIEHQVEENPLLDIENTEPLPKTEEEFTESNIDYLLEKAENHNFTREKQDYKYNENTLAYTLTLSDHLLKQLYLFPLSSEEREIGKFIIGNIDTTGYLLYPIKHLAKSVKASIPKVKKVLSLIQALDPPGIGARDLRECLLLQLKAKLREKSLSPPYKSFNNSSHPYGKEILAYQIIDKFLPFLEKKRYEYIAKKLKVPPVMVKEAVREIAHLEPKPGRIFNKEKALPIIPDAILRKNNDEYEVILNDWELPRITLNNKYKKMIKQKNTSADVKKYLREKLKAANELINAVNKRKEIVKKVIEEIVHLQKDFFDKGVANLKPLTLEQLAIKNKKHKSTISRAISNKYLQTPWGIFELRYFLNSRFKQKNGNYISSATIKLKIKDLVEDENKENPLTDQKIVELLKRGGISISRRTVAKYRHQLKISPSRSRRE